jgi:hypothetical protein
LALATVAFAAVDLARVAEAFGLPEAAVRFAAAGAAAAGAEPVSICEAADTAAASSGTWEAV